MKTLALAVRNLLRNRRRSLATLLAMAIGSMAILLFGGFAKNIKYSMQTAYVRTGGHLQIQHRDFYHYGSGNPTAYGIENYAKLIDAIGRDEVLRDLVVVVTPTLQFGGIAGNYQAGVSRTVIGTGLIAAEQNRMRTWNEFDLDLPAPPLALENAPPDAAIVGVGLGRVLRLCGPLKIPDCDEPVKADKPDGKALADDIAQLSAQETPPGAASAPTGKSTIELLASNARGTPNVASLQVVRAEQQGFKELDEVHVILQLAQAQKLIYGALAPKVTSILVQLRRGDLVALAQSRIQALLPSAAPNQPLAVLDFATLNPFYVTSQQLFDTIFGFIYALIGGIVLFTVGNTMNMAVVERTIEIGTLRAMGVRRGGIRQLFVIEGCLLGVAGAIVGVAGGLVVGYAVNHAGITWLPPAAAEPVPLTLRIWGEWRMILGTGIGLIAIATLSALWPAHRAAKMVVVDALRHT